MEKEYHDFVLENAEVDYELINTYYQRKAPLLKELILKFYTKRKEIKETMKRMEKDGREKEARYADLNDQQEALKINMNALYGKLCEKGHHLGIVYHECQYKEYVNDDLYYPCILTGSFITYRGRLSLVKKIKKVIEAGYNFLYADTDSVIFGCPKDANLEEIFGIDDGDIGQWKDEGTFSTYLNIGRKKRYVLVNREDKAVKLALSGIPRKVQEIFKRQLKTNFDRTLSDLRFLFNPNNNVIIKKVKPITVITTINEQQVIYNTDFKMNPSLKKVSGTITVSDNDYKLLRNDGE